MDSIVTTVNQPLAIEITTTINHHLCFGDSIAAISIDSIYGGVGNYNLFWETNDTTFSVSNLYQDSMGIIITDNANCTQDFMFGLPNPLPFSVNFSYY